MAAKEDKQTSEQIYAAPVPGILDLTIAANKICGTESNPYEIRNALLLEEKKKKIRYKNGENLPNSAINLLNDAARPVRHSRILANNILRADKNLTRPEDVDAHHVVAAQDHRADAARRILFLIWFIAINDAANGLFMRRYPSCKIAGFESCPPHQGVGNIHTFNYHLTVFRRLQNIQHEDAARGRAELRLIASEIIAGIFPF